MRMGANIDPVTRLELRGAEVIEKNEWADHGLRVRRQYTAHAESAQIALSRTDQP